MDTDARIKTYPDIGHKAFGYKGRAIVSMFMYLELYLVAVEFLILEGDNLDKLFPSTAFKLFGLKIGGKQAFVLLASLVVLPTTWLKSFGVMAYVSVGGVLASVVLVCCVLWVGGVDGVGFHERGVAFDLGGLPISISLLAFCYCGHAVFPTLRNSMQDKSQFSKVLLVSFITSTITYGSMAILGHLMYGQHLQSQITLNLPVHKLSSKVAIYTTLINPLTKYAVIITPVATAIEDAFHLANKPRIVSILIRTVIVISTVVVALKIPFFGYFIGAFLSITASIVLPCFCYLRIKKRATGLGTESLVIVTILIVGLFICVTGTYVSVKEIVRRL